MGIIGVIAALAVVTYPLWIRAVADSSTYNSEIEGRSFFRRIGPEDPRCNRFAIGRQISGNSIPCRRPHQEWLEKMKAQAKLQ